MTLATGSLMSAMFIVRSPGRGDEMQQFRHRLLVSVGAAMNAVSCALRCAQGCWCGGCKI